LVFVLLVCSLAVADNNNVHVETDNFVVDANGNQNVPFYSYYLKSNDEERHSVKFSQLYECIGGGGAVPSKSSTPNCQKYGPSNLALPSLSWSFSDVQESNGVLGFNITVTSTESRFDFFQLRNHVRKNASHELKFDVVIQGYNWVSSNPDARLALLFILNGEESAEYWEVAPTASSDGDTILVESSADADNNGRKEYVIYNHFDENLVHDPIFGISTAVVISSSFQLTAAVIIPLLAFFF